MAIQFAFDMGTELDFDNFRDARLLLAALSTHSDWLRENASNGNNWNMEQARRCDELVVLVAHLLN
jgi:hypothetical protein